eukprot:1161414-Pelagomonas_calceolata.AAC.5
MHAWMDGMTGNPQEWTPRLQGPCRRAACIWCTHFNSANFKQGCCALMKLTLEQKLGRPALGRTIACKEEAPQ